MSGTAAQRLPSSYHFLADLYWLAFLLTESQEQSVSIVIDALELLDDVGEISQTSAQLRLREAVIEKAIRAVPTKVTGPSPADSVSCLAVAGSCLEAQERTVSWEDVKNALLGLEIFQRRVLLLTTFEGISRSHAARLLGSDLKSIDEAHLDAICAFVRALSLKVGV